MVGISRDGEETIRNVMELKPDIILLDLQMPKKTGLDVIYYIQRNVEFDKIDIIITSGDTTLINKTNILKNDFIKYVFVKPFALEDLSNIIDRLSIDYQNYIKNEVKSVLKNFDFNICSKSYESLVCCIEKSVENPALLSNIEKLLYEEVAKIMKLENKYKMIWGIQKLIKSMNRYTNSNIINKFFPYNENPSPKVFIKTISDIVRRNIKK